MKAIFFMIFVFIGVALVECGRGWHKVNEVVRYEGSYGERVVETLWENDDEEMFTYRIRESVNHELRRIDADTFDEAMDVLKAKMENTHNYSVYMLGQPRVDKYGKPKQPEDD